MGGVGYQSKKWENNVRSARGKERLREQSKMVESSGRAMGEQWEDIGW